jgi:hypothetical protein
MKSVSAEKRSALAAPNCERKRLSQQLALRQTIEARMLKQKLANRRTAIQKISHPVSWRHFVASRVGHRNARAIRLLRERERGRSSEEREW